MKTIELKKGEALVPGTETTLKLTTLSLIGECLDHAPPKGFTREDLKKRAIVDKAIEKQTEGIEDLESLKELQLEDAVYETVQQVVREMTWGVRSKFIAEFVESFENN